jgi:hypothetical protein
VEDPSDLNALVAHLVRTSPLETDLASRVVSEVVEYFSEPTETFVRRRHRELQAGGLVNAVIFGQLAQELPRWRVVPPPLSPRQLRRIVYG